MTDPRDRPPVWFSPRRYGYGAGLPVTWQGWAVLAGFVLGLVLITTALSGAARLIALVVLVGILFAVAGRRTQGGWRWRWGERD